MSVSELSGVARRAARFFTSKAFLRHPVESVSRRIAWRTHWKLRPERPLMIDYVDGLRLKLAHSSASSGIYLNRGPDRIHADLFLGFLRQGMVAFDVGAHIGEYTVLFGSAVGSGGWVHAFEPDPRVLPFLRENVEINHLANVTVNGVALADRKAAESFTPRSDATASGLTRFSQPDETRTLPVPTTTIDAYVEENGIGALDAIKIDVEGAELAVLKGAVRTLQVLRPGLLLVECHGAGIARSAASALRQADYVVDMDSGHAFPHLRARPTNPR